ncbi:MAG: PucR family transcriptional regulator ligand-binding domain-containing protein [Roseburia faecis]|nr:PucR family transcriptional regulator ligand-binding domain-containing protein [Roseburia faecis]MDY4477841.1 PucR family transcriptional regulator ligand-binding domain-containing protein [Roseburia faecis]
MSITLREIVKQVEHLEMKLVAGEAGLDREVLWTHMVDSDTISAFLQGQELTFTTGIGISEKLPLLKLVQEVYRNGASGIVINIGPYVDKIGQDVLDFANEKAFPVFEVPWKIHMAEIMRIICFAITKEQQSRIEVTAALNNAFLCPAQEELYVFPLMRKGYLADSVYTAVTIRVEVQKNTVAGERMEQLHSQLGSHLRCNYKRILCCAQEKQLVLVLCDYTGQERKHVLTYIFQHFCNELKKEETAVFCVGNEAEELRQLHKSYETANQMAEVSALGRIPGEEVYGRHKMIVYKNAGIFRILFALKDEEVMQEYVRDTVQPLLEYDALHHTDLAGVLQCYLRHDGSLQDTANELIVHRNTVNYKINKASEILEMDLTRLENRLEVMLGFGICQILHK